MAPLISRYEPPPGFDRDALRRITGGDDRLAEGLVKLLFSELPRHRGNLRTALAEGDLQTLVRVAHTLAGGSAYCAATHLKLLSTRLEEVTRKGERRRIRDALDELDREIGAILDADA